MIDQSLVLLGIVVLFPLVAIIIVMVQVALFLTPPSQAYLRGQGFWRWVLLSLFSLNPLYLLLLIAMLPNRRRMRMREAFEAELDAKLATSASSPQPVSSPVLADRSLGDRETAASVQQSLGDQPTRAPDPNSTASS